ncbi:hypothetical protein BC829DRAFT_417758 [Chytridium lagenaria]|nr:hypothetical protein BC829DRAFT_417758 [Chytridium lagenaria]
MDARKLLRQKKALRKAEAPKDKAPVLQQSKQSHRPSTSNSTNANEAISIASKAQPIYGKPHKAALSDDTKQSTQSDPSQDPIATDPDAAESDVANDKLPAGFFDSAVVSKSAVVVDKDALAMDEQLRQFQMEIGDHLDQAEVKAAQEDEEEEEIVLDDAEDEGRLFDKLASLKSLREKRAAPSSVKISVIKKAKKIRKVVEDDEDEDNWRSRRA